MSRPKSSWGDIANFGTNVYQARQMSKLSEQQAEHNALLQKQMENMQRQQMMEEMNKKVLKHARTLILEFEDQINATEKILQTNPIMASIETDALEMAFKDSQSVGIDSDFFEEMYDLERYRKVDSGINKLKQLTSNLTNEQSTIKDNIISYSVQNDDLEQAIILAENIPAVQARQDVLSKEVSRLQPQWDRFKSNTINSNKKFKKKLEVGSFISCGIILILTIMAYNSDALASLEQEEGVEFFSDMVVGGACCLILFVPLGANMIWDDWKIRIPTRISVEKELENEERQKNHSNNSDLEFLVSHARDPFEKYFVVLEDTFGHCKRTLERLKKEYQSLTSSIGVSQLGELSSLLQTNREYIEFYSRENLNGRIDSIDSGNEPNYSLNGELNDDGWEVLEFPFGSDNWWWKDHQNLCWQAWD